MVKINEGEGEAELFVLLVIEGGELTYPTKQPSSLRVFISSLLKPAVLGLLHYLKCEIPMPLMGYSVWKLPPLWRH